MPTEIPIACSLTADELPARMVAATKLGRDGLLDVSTSGARAELRFRDDESIRAGIEEFVASESECCPFFTFEQRDEGEATVLSIEAPEEGTLVLRGVVAGFVGGWEMAS